MTMNTENKTNTNTTTNTTITSNSAEVIEKTQGLYEAVHKTTNETISTVDYMVSRRVAEEIKRVESANEDKITAKVASKLDEAVMVKTTALQGKLSRAEDFILTQGEKLIKAESEINRLSTKVDEYENHADFCKEVAQDAKEAMKDAFEKAIKSDKEVTRLTNELNTAENKIEGLEDALSAERTASANRLSNKDKLHKMKLTQVKEDLEAQLLAEKELHEAEMVKMKRDIEDEYTTALLKASNNERSLEQTIKVLHNELDVYKALAKKNKSNRFVQALKLMFNL